MKDSLYHALLIAVTVLVVAAIIAFTVFTVNEYLNCSIIAFLAKEWWPK